MNRMITKSLKPVLFAGLNTSDIELLTVKAYKAIQAAEIVVIDCLLKFYLSDIKRINANVIHLHKHKMADEEEHRSHTIKLIGFIENEYKKGKQVIRMVDMVTFLSDQIKTEQRLLKSRAIETQLLPELWGNDFTSVNKKKVSFFSINCRLRNVSGLWDKMAESYRSGNAVLLYSDINIGDQLNYFLETEQLFHEARVETLHVGNKTMFGTDGQICDDSASVYFISQSKKEEILI
jgi:hypothetical protein